jgi:hypothetical protein
MPHGDTNPTGGVQFNRVTADWVQPAMNCTKSPAGAKARFWVGLGDITDQNQVERAGIEADCKAGRASYRLFYQVVPDNPVYVGLATTGVHWLVTMQYVDPYFNVSWQPDNADTVSTSFTCPDTGAGTCDRSAAEVVAGTVQNCTNAQACFDAPPPDSKQWPLARYSTVTFSDIQFHDNAGHYDTLTSRYVTAQKIVEKWNSTTYEQVGRTEFKGGQFTDTWHHA